MGLCKIHNLKCENVLKLEILVVFVIRVSNKDLDF